MTVKEIQGKIVFIANGKADEAPYREDLSKILIQKYGDKDFESQEEIRRVIVDSMEYFATKFNEIIEGENSMRFYQVILDAHNDITELMYLSSKELEKEVSLSYIALYRRLLKWILGKACDIKLHTKEAHSEKVKRRVEDKLNKLYFLGDMLFSCANFYAEQDMIEDLADFKFIDGLYFFSRKHHYDTVVEELRKEIGSQVTKTVSDEESIIDLSKALKKCFGFSFDDAKNTIGLIHHELSKRYNYPKGYLLGFNWDSLPKTLSGNSGIAIDRCEAFFEGLTLTKNNKMDLITTIIKPYNINRHIYKPILIWNIDGADFAVVTPSSWIESIYLLTTNMIPWGKAPVAWMENECFKRYVHSKEDEHDKWLEDEIEKIITEKKMPFERNCENLKLNSGFLSITPGEIDFLILNKKRKVIHVVDSKHLMGRYDAVNQKNDYNAFVTNRKSYNSTMRKKIDWFEEERASLQDFFRLKTSDLTLDLSEYKIVGEFVINTPTFQMFNNPDFRIYLVEKYGEILEGTYMDKEFMIVYDKEEFAKIMNPRYPYFQKPSYLVYDPYKLSDSTENE